MRKAIKIISVITLALVLLTGCSSNVVTKVSNGDEVIIDIKDNQIKKEQIYKYIKLNFGPSLINTNLLEMQLEKNVTLDDEDKKEAQSRLDETKELLGEDFEQILVGSGYKDIEDYYDRVVLNMIKNEKLFKSYLDENLEDITTGLNTAKIKKIKVNTTAEANEALKELNENEDLTADDFVSMAKTYSKDETAESTIEYVYEGRTELTFLNDKLIDVEPGLIDEAIMDGEDVYIIYVEELDLEADKNEIIASMIENEEVNQIVNQAMFAHYSSLGDFKIHDSDLYELLK